MVLPRASSMRNAFRRSTLRGSGPRVRTRFNQHIGRRAYASEHGSQKASSDLPWLIGSIVVTVPSAAWLWAQGPKKGEGHGHGSHEEHAEHEEGDEESKDEADESDEKSKDDQKDDSENQNKEEGGADDKAKAADKDQGAPEDSGSENGDDKEKDTPPTSDDEGGEDKPGPDAPKQINKPSGGKGAGETSKGSRSATEKKGEKDSK